MKLRIKANSIRLRLSRPDIQQLTSSGYLEERTPFGNITFVYAIQSKHGDALSADFDGCKITVFIPESFLENWAENNLTGFEGRVPVTHTETLHILVEKDFQCLDNRGEDQSSNYDNPNQSHL